MNKGLLIEPVRSAEDLKATIRLFRAYVAWLDLDLSFQDFETEMAAMPGKYAPPKGELLLAKNDKGTPIGCVAVRLLTADCCEMKRLYVLPDGRGLGAGKALIRRIIDVAASLGYREIRLDTLPRMQSAIALYESFGFIKIPPYYANPLSDVIYLGCRLSPPVSNASPPELSAQAR